LLSHVGIVRPADVGTRRPRAQRLRRAAQLASHCSFTRAMT
jgi:hypothetical protein